MSVAAAPFLLLAAGLMQAAPPPTPPVSIDGRLEPGSPRADPGDGYGPRLYEDHRLHLEGGARYRITAHSDFGGAGFDPGLEIRQQASGPPLALNNNIDALATDGPESGDAALDFTPTRSGDYIVRIRTSYQDEHGVYQARVTALPAIPPPFAAPPNAAEPLAWRVIEGELREGDSEAFESYYDDIAVPMRAGELRILTVAPLGAVGPDEEEIRNMLFNVDVVDPAAMPDDLHMANSFARVMAFRAPRDGNFFVRVSALHRTGRYQVRISEGR